MLLQRPNPASRRRRKSTRSLNRIKRLALPRQSSPPRMLHRRLRCRTSCRGTGFDRGLASGTDRGQSSTAPEASRSAQVKKCRHGAGSARRGAGFGCRSGRRGGSFATGRTDAARQRIGAEARPPSAPPPPACRRASTGPAAARRDRPQRERDRPPVKRFERREKAPDPNSPFAKLAALKAQLEAEAKERR